MSYSPFRLLVVFIILTSLTAATAHFSGPRFEKLEFLPVTSERPQEQIALHFSRPMKTESFEQNFSIAPELPVRLSWSNGVLYLTSENPIPSGQKFELTIKDSAQDIYGKALFSEVKKEFSLSYPTYIFINKDGQLTQKTLEGEEKTLTNKKTIREYVVDGISESVWFLEQSSDNQPTKLWRHDLKTGKQEQFLRDRTFQIKSLSLARQGAELILLVQPVLADTNEVLSAYHFSIAEKSLQNIELGELGLTLTALDVAGDGNTLVTTTLDSAQYLRTLSGDKTAALTKLSTYRGSNRTGTLLIFEDIVPDKNYAGEVVLYDGGLKRIIDEDATLLMPAISFDGTLVAYSFQPRSAFMTQSVTAGEALKLAFEMPVSGLRRQKTQESSFEWEKYDATVSYELPKFSPDGSLLAVEVFTKEQLQDLKNLRSFGEPNKPVLGTLQFIDQKGKFLPEKIAGRELQWLDVARKLILY